MNIFLEYFNVFTLNITSGHECFLEGKKDTLSKIKFKINSTASKIFNDKNMSYVIALGSVCQFVASELLLQNINHYTKVSKLN